MADVKLTGPALIDDIARTRPEEGTLAFWWMGQASYIYKGSCVIYLDPYLTPSPARQTPPLLKYEEVTNADLILCTHDHLDHIDPDTLPPVMKASPQAILVVPRPHLRRVLDLGIPEERVVGLSHMEMFERDGVHLTALKSKHEAFDEHAEHGFPFLGYVVETNDYSFYHSGDTVPYEGLLTSLQEMMPHAVFLPINGRDAERFQRNCLGNMTFQEAVDLAGEVGAAWAIPHHWDMFRGNQEDPQKFVSYLNCKYPEVKTWVGPAGERVVIGS
ncbi:MAG: MBL fold metallo-hydrolase [Armatimonadetes bacterium]|nr:MBL fold metallo-hydrolase [Armatimonadota bacterium]